MKYDYIIGQTPLDENEKCDLIPSVITRKDLDQLEQENIIEAREWAMRSSILANQNVFSEIFILNLHKRMYGHVWKWAGKYRKSNKNIGVDYYMVRTEFHQLLSDAIYWMQHKTYSMTELAIIFHHRLVKIHLFPNGNGRHARLCADVIIAKYGGKKLTWVGHSSLIKPDAIRKQYIASLREADQGNYDLLIAFAKGKDGLF
ncbi:MAG: mobile mystery protein [Candidatus Midichloriaceae bacterium]|jgi:Fic-DOC domain mobile mystery protein B|nr:mobile mystery protein [Candidatus Midichloriaceae bacterium]